MDNSLTQRIARYAVAAIATPLPAAVMDKAKHHVLDTIAAIVSGATLEPGVISRNPEFVKLSVATNAIPYSFVSVEPGSAIFRSLADVSAQVLDTMRKTIEAGRP